MGPLSAFSKGLANLFDGKMGASGLHRHHFSILISSYGLCPKAMQIVISH
jgi:hypothetical protein